MGSESLKRRHDEQIVLRLPSARKAWLQERAEQNERTLGAEVRFILAAAHAEDLNPKARKRAA